jgi:hypothetical protein
VSLKTPRTDADTDPGGRQGRAAKLRAMADVKTFTEKRMAIGAGLDFERDC